MRRRRRHTSEHDNLSRWLVSYADYMTLMFALFVMLYAVSLVNKDQYQGVIDTFYSVTKEFAGKSAYVGEPGLLDGDTDKITQDLGAGILDDAGSVTQGGEDLSSITKAKLGTPLNTLEDEFNETLLRIVESGVAKVNLDQDWLTIDISSGLIFPSGSTQPSNSARALMQEIAGIVSPVNNFLRVRGYTDNQSISNEVYNSNWELSVARATSVLRLLEQSGVNPARMAVEGYGEYYPVESNSSVDGRRKNRRVVIAVSRYAWQPKTIENAEVTITQPVAGDSTEVQEITLPNGGLIITTRQEL